MTVSRDVRCADDFDEMVSKRDDLSSAGLTIGRKSSRDL